MRSSKSAGIIKDISFNNVNRPRPPGPVDARPERYRQGSAGYTNGSDSRPNTHMLVQKTGGMTMLKGDDHITGT